MKGFFRGLLKVPANQLAVPVKRVMHNGSSGSELMDVKDLLHKQEPEKLFKGEGSQEDISKKNDPKLNSVSSVMYIQSVIDGMPHESLKDAKVGENFPLQDVLEVMKVMRESRLQKEALKKEGAAQKRGFHAAAGAKKPLSIEEQLEEKKSILSKYEKKSDSAEILGAEIKEIEQEIARRAELKEQSKLPSSVVKPEESVQLLNETLDHVRG